MSYNKLSKKEKKIIEEKGTEMPFSGKYDDFYQKGVYVCRRCNFPLFSSKAKFNAECGWPSFDENYPKAIDRVLDSDGIRTEILCVNCKAHLGHVFLDENLTTKNTRHCVNSLSIKFIPDSKKIPKTLYV